VQFISIGMVTQPLNLLAAALLMARGKFRRLAGATAVMVLVLLGTAALGSLFGQQRAIAMSVTAGMVIGNLYAGWLVFQEFGKGWSQLWGALLPALKLAAPLALVTWGVCHSSSSLNALSRSFLTAGACGVTYLVLLRWCHPEILNDVVLRMSRRRTPGTSPQLQP
jgi:hypothetical protein